MKRLSIFKTPKYLFHRPEWNPMRFEDDASENIIFIITERQWALNLLIRYDRSVLFSYCKRCCKTCPNARCCHNFQMQCAVRRSVTLCEGVIRTPCRWTSYRRKRRMSAAAFSQIRYRDIAGDVFNSEQRCPSSTSVAEAFASTHQNQQRQQHDPLQVVNAGSSSVPSRFVSNEPSE